MPEILKDYFDALDRLKRGKPINVRNGVNITNDSVSLEAGRKKGSIKKSRPVFRDLIEAINAAASDECKPPDKMRARLDHARAEAIRYRTLWEEALAREVSLVKELWDAREAWSQERDAMVTGNVSTIRQLGTKPSRSGLPENRK